MSDKKDKPQRLGSLSDLGQLKAQLPPGTKPPAQAVKTPTATAPARNASPLRLPVTVQNKNRAGRAPYTFVPLPSTAKWVEAPPPADRYDPALESGVIAVELQALTDFYVRGMWSLEQYQKLEEKDGKRAPQTAPFLVTGQLRLPGSSLRGMVRALVEILGEAPLDPVNDQQLFFRAVAASSHYDPRRPNTFEPQAEAYKARVAPAGAGAPGVRVGYLYAERDHWAIQPALVDANGRQWYRHRTRDSWKIAKVWFRPAAPEPWAETAFERRDGWHEGHLVCSGPMQKKTAQWVVHAEDPAAQKVDVPDYDVAAYRDGGKTRDIPTAFHYDKARSVPCFYVEWNGPEGERHISFGHTHYFRLPYRNTTTKGIPDAVRRAESEARWDLAQAIFGRAPKHAAGTVKGARGRVAFEDAVWTGGPEVSFDPAVRSIVLGQPKPTTYQHYLVQRSENVEESIHWDGDKDGRGVPVVRGHKMYWHRPGVAIPVTDKDNVASRLQPAYAGARFYARIRYENLRAHELGALLLALQPFDGCAHRLGMGKPLGLGSFRIKIVGFEQVDRAQRYRKFFAGEAAGDGTRLLETGARNTNQLLGERVAEFQNRFAAWLRGEGAKVAELWREPRLRELQAVLRWVEQPATDWLAATRYLEFGKVLAADGRERDYNEYSKIGYPGRIEHQARRPLPSAQQVAALGPAIPTDPRPPYLPPKSKSRR